MFNPRKLLFPFSVLYHSVTEIRNRLYDAGLLESEKFEVPVICVGNLNVGGTGKSPMIEFLLDNFQGDFKVAVLSRGYRRKTKGFRMVETHSTVAEVGDEPLQFKRKFPAAMIAVEANRREGIKELLKYSPDVVLLDDAFQHRRVKAGLNILLTSFDKLYTDDYLLPAGDLRESRQGSQRAQIIIVTKCPLFLDAKQKEQIIDKINPKRDQKVFFTGIDYDTMVHSENKKIPLNEIPEDYALVTGIAKPKPLIEYLEKQGLDLKHIEFPDHYNFSHQDLLKLRREKGILATEKDYMRLKGRMDDTPLFYLPIKVKFLEKETDFRNSIRSFINEK